ncbi:MAG: cache domain-containing protein [Desulfuromonadales bacterium]|nr:cache domain-containing protein [Desulfuromonadales bacterium]
MKSVPQKGMSIRGKMTLAALTPLVTILLLVSFAAFYLINGWIVGNTQQQIRNDLSAAHEVLHHEELRISNIVRFTVSMDRLARALTEGDLQFISEELEIIRQREGLDLLTLTDETGKIIRAEEVVDKGAPLSFARQVLRGDEFSGTVLLTPAEMLREAPDLAARALIRHNDIPGADERRGMVLIGAAPLRNRQQEVIGCLYGGILLNGNLTLIDRIKDVVYGEKRYEGTEIGSATIFLEGLRIATTIRLKNGDRALGTEISREVADAVLEDKQTWLARARVVDEWYLTAYEPILGPAGQAIGVLYVGQLEEPFNALKRKISLLLVGLLLLGGTLGLLLSLAIARRLSRPLQQLAASAKRVAAGDTEILLPITSHDEIGHLTRTFNQMTATLRERDQRLLGLNRELEGKVQQRTAELEEKGLQLIRAQEKLLHNEKLAAIGSLAAGVAHEINNPTAIIRGNVELLQMILADGAPGREETDEILKQTERVSMITRNLLSFAREQVVTPEQVQLNDLLEEILAQLSHQVSLRDIQVVRAFSPSLPPVEGDRERLRQVFTNVLLNAVQAMDGRGTLSLGSHAGDRSVRITIQDSGPGLSDDLRGKIFNPFFTTKSNGTGLGLSVSYGIVQAHGGSIDVFSGEEGGAVFQVHLPFPHAFSDNHAGEQPFRTG